MSGCSRSETAVFVNVRYKNQLDTLRDGLYNRHTSKVSLQGPFSVRFGANLIFFGTSTAIISGAVSAAKTTRALPVAQRLCDSV